MPNFNGMINGRPVKIPSIHTELPTIETIMETSPQQQQEEEQKLQAPIIKKLAREIFSQQNKKARKVYSNWENFERINPNAARSYRMKAEIQHQEALEEIAKEDARLVRQAEILCRRIEKEEREEEDKKRRLEEARRVSSIQWNHRRQSRRAQKVKDKNLEEGMGSSSGGVGAIKDDVEGEDQSIVKTEIKQWQERALMGEGMDVADMTRIMSAVQLGKHD